jgi:hypothetical protein
MATIFLAVVVGLGLSGCPGQSAQKGDTPPGVKTPPLPVKVMPPVRALQERPPVAQLPKSDLPAREQEDDAGIEVCTVDKEQIDSRRKADTVNAIKDWLFWIKIGLAAAGVILAGILAYLQKYQMAVTVIGAGSLIEVLAWGLGWVLLHMGAVGIVAGLIVLGFLAWKAWEHYDELRDFATQSAKTIADPKALAGQLANSKVHTLDSFTTLWQKLKG